MNRIPTVDELVQAALEGGEVSIHNAPPVEKIAAVTDSSSDVMEQTASELDKWAEQTQKHQENQAEISTHNQEETTHNRILKLAMASTILNTLQGLSDHGHLDRLVEKVAVSRFAQQAAKRLLTGRKAAEVVTRHIKTRRGLQKQVSGQMAKATAAETRAGQEIAKRKGAEQAMKKWQLGAGAAGAAGLAGAGLAYQAGAKRERKRTRAMERFRRYR